MEGYHLLGKIGWSTVVVNGTCQIADFGVFPKFARTRLCGHFWSRSLQKNVLRGLHFKGILIRRSWDLRRSVFQAAKVGLLFGRFSLGPPFEASQKMADFGVFAKFARTRLCGHFWSRGLLQNVLRWLHFKGILIKTSWKFPQGCARSISTTFSGNN